MTLPNFLYIGPDKAGSSWLHETLILHPEVYLSVAKDLYYFDRYFSRGIEWYERQFDNATPQQTIVGEICQDYLADAKAPARIRETLPDCKLMVTVRDPVERAFSSYLYMRKHGIGPGSFSEALKTRPELVEHGRYGQQLRRYRDLFPSEHIHVAVFDDLGSEQQTFFDSVTDFLSIGRMQLSDEVAGVRLPASKARVMPVARVVRGLADVVRTLDGANAVARVKRSRIVQGVLYRPLGDDKPTVPPQDAAYIRSRLADDVQLLEGDLGLDLRNRWGW